MESLNLSPMCRRNALALACVLAVACLPAYLFAQQAITFQYLYDDLNRLVKVVDSTGAVVQYVYDPAGNNIQIVRSTVTPGALTIFNVTPGTALSGTAITIQGQGFSATPSGNTVTLNGAALTVISASVTTLVAEVPPNAASGPVSVTVGAVTVTSPSPEAILPAPYIRTLSPKSALAGSPFTLTVTGANLAGSAFVFFPPLPITSASVDSGGTSATLVVSPAATAKGYYTLVGTNAAASSTALPQLGFMTGVTAFNTISIPGSSANADADSDGVTNGQEIAAGTDPLNPDTDGDRYPDGVEILYGSDPLNAASVPILPQSNGYLAGKQFSLENAISPASGAPQTHTVSGLTFSTLNSTLPTFGAPQIYSISGLAFSTLNSTAPTFGVPQTYSISGLAFSIRNSVSPLNTGPQTYSIGGLMFSMLNGLAPQSQLSGVSPSLRFLLPVDPTFLAEALLRGSLRINGQPVCTDTDGDGICDSDELRIGTNPYLVDSDGDGYPDGLELALGSDPLDPRSIPDIRSPGYLATPPMSIRNIIPIAKLAPRRQGAIHANDVR